MRKVGHRKEQPLSFSASAQLLSEGARFNDAMQGLPTGNTSFIPKGVFRFMSHEEANRHQADCLIQGMARVARARE